jgi:hypothetical protein
VSIDIKFRKRPIGEHLLHDYKNVEPSDCRDVLHHDVGLIIWNRLSYEALNDLAVVGEI